MQRYIALLGGMNVGGHRIKMDELCRLFEAANCQKPSAFIASGNVIFSTAKRDRAGLEAALATHLEASLGYHVPTFLRTPEEIDAIIRYEPFDLEAAGSTMHVCFLHRPMTEVEQSIAKACNCASDELHPHGSELYWLCRGRVTESQIKWKPLAKKIGESTARNITMLRRLSEHLKA